MTGSTEFRQVNRRRLYQQVADDLERLILNGTYALDSRLPSEQELADSYHVSRNVIREALKTLKELGLVSIHTGSGTYVRRPTVKPVSEAIHRFIRHSASAISFTQLFEARRIIEPDIAHLAAQRASDEDLQKIHTALQAMELCGPDPRLTSQADVDFHLSVAAATHNPLAASLLDSLIAPMHDMLVASYTAQPFHEETGQPHRRIYGALCAHDAEQARAEMLDHLLKGEQELLELGLTQEPQP